MSEPTGQRPPIPPQRPRRSVWDTFNPARLVFGLVLAAFGVIWLLDVSDVVDVDLDVVLPIGLIVVGVALLVSGTSGRSGGGLFGLGAVLIVILVLTTLVRVPFTGGVGDRTERPARFADRTYELGVGKLTVDLTAFAFDAETDPLSAAIEANVGIGQLVVLLPARSEVPCVSVDAHAGIGEVVVFGESRGGLGPDYQTRDVCTGPPVPELELSTGIGQVEVRRV